MADGNYGGNGSIYWENHLPGHPKTAGKDPTAVGNINGGKGYFTVNMRFCASPVGSSTEAAVAAFPGGANAFNAAKTNRRLSIETHLQNLVANATQALQAVQNGADDVKLAVDVPAVSRPKPPAGPPDDPWEVNVHW